MQDAEQVRIVFLPEDAQLAHRTAQILAAEQTLGKNSIILSVERERFESMLNEVAHAT